MTPLAVSLVLMAFVLVMAGWLLEPAPALPWPARLTRESNPVLKKIWDANEEAAAAKNSLKEKAAAVRKLQEQAITLKEANAELRAERDRALARLAFYEGNGDDGSVGAPPRP